MQSVQTMETHLVAHAHLDLKKILTIMLFALVSILWGSFQIFLNGAYIDTENLTALQQAFVPGGNLKLLENQMFFFVISSILISSSNTSSSNLDNFYVCICDTISYISLPSPNTIFTDPCISRIPPLRRPCNGFISQKSPWICPKNTNKTCFYF